MENIEQRVMQWIEGNAMFLSKRVKRFLAMYFPQAGIRRRFWMETNVELGDGAYLNPNVTVVDDYMSDRVLLKIGCNCSIAPGVVFAPCSVHNNSKKLRKMGVLDGLEGDAPIEIGDDVWIGANSTVLPGVTIGSCSVIGANSLVNRDIPPFSLAYGAPARVAKSLRDSGEPEEVQ